MDKTGRASLNSFTETEKCPIQFVSLYFFFFNKKPLEFLWTPMIIILEHEWIRIKSYLKRSVDTIATMTATLSCSWQFILYVIENLNYDNSYHKD